MAEYRCDFPGCDALADELATNLAAGDVTAWCAWHFFVGLANGPGDPAADRIMGPVIAHSDVLDRIAAASAEADATAAAAAERLDGAPTPARRPAGRGSHRAPRPQPPQNGLRSPETGEGPDDGQLVTPEEIGRPEPSTAGVEA